MAATERRLGVSRRGMTVLGKVPVAPKPLNLPSQRSTFCWGNGGRFQSALIDPESNGEKFESKLVAPVVTKKQDGVDLQGEKMQSLSATARAKASSPGAAASTDMAFNNGGKMEEPRKFAGDPCNSKSWRQEVADPSHQKNGDGCLKGASSAPPGFSHNGSQGNNPRSAMSSTDSQGNGVGNGNHSDASQHNGSQGIPGTYRSGTKDREIIVIHMVGGPGFYGNYPPQFGFPESYNRNGGLFGGFPLQFGNFEPVFGLPGHCRIDGGAQFSATAGSEYSDEHDFVCYEKECFKGACRDLRRHRNSWVHGSFGENTFLGGAQGDVYDSLISGTTPTIRSRSFSQRHLSKNAGRSRSLYRNGRMVPVSTEESIAESASEKRITLLTKVSQRDVLARNPLKVVGDGCKGVQKSSVSYAYLNEEFDEDEGKPPEETFEPKKVNVSLSLEMVEEPSSTKEAKVESDAVPSSNTTCNDKCLHCKNDAAIGASATLVCHACEKTTVCESNFTSPHSDIGSTEEVPVAFVGKDSCSDGCNSEVKHVILDADNYSINTMKSEAVSKEQEIAGESKSSFIVSQSGNAEVSKGTNSSSDSSLKKSAERQQKLVFRKKSQSKALSKPGIRVSKAHVMARKPGSQGGKLTLAISASTPATDSKESLEEEDAAQEENRPSPTSQENGTTLAPPKKNAVRQQKVYYRKRTAGEADVKAQSGRKDPNFSQSAKSLSVLAQAELGIEQEKDGAKLTSSVSTSKYHIIRRRVYHVVEGSEGAYYVPTVPLPCDDKSNQFSRRQLESLQQKPLPVLTATSEQSESESALLQESKSQSKSHSSCSEHAYSAVFSLQPSRSPILSSTREDIATQKYVKSGRQTAWKPKVTPQTTGSGSVSKKQEKLSGFPALITVEASEEKTGSLCSGPVDISSNPNLQKTDENNLPVTRNERYSDSEDSSSGHFECEQDSQFSSQHLLSEKAVEEAVVNVVSVGELGEVKSEPVQNHLEELPPFGSWAQGTCHNAEAAVPEQDKHTCNEETTSGLLKPFIKKKAMSYEQANHYHQIMFKRYKEIGQWKLKAEVHKKAPKRKGKDRSS